MRDAARLYLRYVGFSIRSQMQYRVSMLIYLFGQLLITGIEFFAVWSLFERFGSLKGWSLPQVALLYGMVHIAMSIANLFARGFDTFTGMVKSGGFDRYLLRPRSTAFQVGSREVQLFRLGRMVQGMAVLIWAVTALDVDWNLANATLLVTSILGGACLFVGLFIMQASMAFWTIESLEIVNALTYGGVETAQYPLAIYGKWFRRFFTFVVPLACLNYFPSVVITGGPDPLDSPAIVGWLSPLVGVVFLLVSFRVWRFGVRHYRSTGS